MGIMGTGKSGTRRDRLRKCGRAWIGSFVAVIPIYDLSGAGLLG